MRNKTRVHRRSPPLIRDFVFAGCDVWLQMIPSNHSSDPQLNGSLPGCESTGAMKETILEKSAKTIAYSILLLVSLVGNCLVIAIVSKKRTMWTTTNILITNMAASDLLMALFATPVAISETLSGETQRQWHLKGTFGSITCKLTYLLQDMSTVVSILSLVTISLDRFSAIVFPFRRALISPKSCRIVIPVIWLCALAIHSPYLYTVKLQTVGNATQCQFNWEPAFGDHKRAQNIYYLILLAVLLGPSLVTIIALHSAMLSVLRKHPPRSWPDEEHVLRMRQKEDARVMTKVVVIMVVFLICFAPFTVCAILYYYVWDWRDPCGVDVQTMFFIAKFFLFSNTAINPCLYFSLYERYRKAFCVLLGRTREAKSSQIRSTQRRNRPQQDTPGVANSTVWNVAVKRQKHHTQRKWFCLINYCRTKKWFPTINRIWNISSGPQREVKWKQKPCARSFFFYSFRLKV